MLAMNKRNSPMIAGRSGNDHGFTLIELLVVITIILIVSAVALPTVFSALSQRQASEAARIVQAALVGARDTAIRNGAPSGIRLLPDPIFNGYAATTTTSGTTSTTTLQLNGAVPLAYNRIIPIDPAPEYSEGLVNINLNEPPGGMNWVPLYPYDPYQTARYPLHLFSVTSTGATTVDNANANNANGQFANANVLMIEEAVVTTSGTTTVPNSPTTWYWNIRVGDKIQINNAGPWYTIVGPLTVGASAGNTELFVNVGVPGTISPLTRAAGIYPEFLFVVNGADDNGNGRVDEGSDGVDNDGQKIDNLYNIDDLYEWEYEAWPSLITSNFGLPSSLPYTIQRRPTPSSNAREVSLPSSIVIDATTWNNSSLERSRFPSSCFNHFSGFVDILLNPDGSLLPTTTYSSPSSFPMGGSFVHLWLADRQDVVAPLSATTATNPPALPVVLPSGVSAATGNYTLLKSDYRLITLFSRTGQITNDGNMPFFDQNGNYNVNQPYLNNELGLTGTP